MTKLAVKSTMIVASKCFLSMNSVISDASTKHIEGMNTDRQKGKFNRLNLISSLTDMLLADIEMSIT